MACFFRDINLLLKHGICLTLRDIPLTCYDPGCVPYLTWVLFLNIFFVHIGSQLQSCFLEEITKVSGKMCSRLDSRTDLILFVFYGRNLYLNCSFILFFSNQRFLMAKFRLLRHCFPVFFRVSQLSGSWNILFQELKRKFLDYEIL